MDAASDDDRAPTAVDLRLAPLVAAFDRGDFARVRRGTRDLLASDAPAELLAAARALRDKTTPDPRAAVFFGLTAALLVVLSGYAWALSHR